MLLHVNFHASCVMDGVSCSYKVFAPTKTCFYAFLYHRKFFYVCSNMFLCLCGVGWLEGFLYFWCEVNGGSDIIGHDLRRSQLPWLVTVA